MDFQSPLRLENAMDLYDYLFPVHDMLKNVSGKDVFD